MALSRTTCPDCDRQVSPPLHTTITGRQVCQDCARALTTASAAGAITSSPGIAAGVWATLMRKIKEKK